MQQGTIRKTALAALAGAGVALSSVIVPAAAQDYPTQSLDWTIAFGPGGGNDIMSRKIIEIIEQYELYPQPIVPTNRAGGSGAVGWGYLFNQAGSPYHISSTSGSFINTPLQADTPWQPTSFTPLALLAADDLVLVVNASSDVTTFEEFIESARNRAPAIGGIGSVNIDFIVTELLTNVAEFDARYVAFNAQGELTTALLSNALDAMVVNPGEVLGLIESGDIVPLVFTGIETPDALGDLPTLADFGYEEASVSMPRGVVMAPDVPDEIKEWWIDVLRQVVETPEWEAYIDENLLTENILFGDEFENYLVRTQDQFATVLRDAGVIQ